MEFPPRPIRPLPGTPAEESDEGIRAGLITRIIIVTTVVLGQLWALTVALESHLLGERAAPWWLALFSIVSFAVVLVLVRLDPARRGGRRRPGRR